MKEKILIGKNEFTLDTDGDYVGVMDIWGERYESLSGY